MSRRRVVVAGAAVAGIAVVGGLAVATGTFGADPASAGSGNTGTDLPPGTEAVTRQDLVDTESADGTLGYQDPATIINQRRGTVTWLPGDGTVRRRGSTLYRVDTLPVTLMYGKVPAYRRLAVGVEGDDVRQLERNLRTLGYPGFTVDEEFSSATASAVKEWQEDRGLAVTGSVESGQVVFTPGAVRVTSAEVALGGQAAPGPVLEVTGTSRVVTVPLPVSDQRFVRKGASVQVELPGGKTVKGRISDVGTVAETAGDDQQDQQDSEATIDVTVALNGSSGSIDQAPVTVEFVSERRKDVLTVPVAALLALSEGGYGVQVVGGGTSRIVAVRTGMFADGRVEVSGAGVAEGVSVGVPKL